MNEFVGYIYFDRTREWEGFFSENPHWADDDEDWYLGGAVRTLADIHSLLSAQGFDDEYISNFMAMDLSHYQYYMLLNAGKEQTL